ncbi:MAG: hypothetical protein ACLVLH_08330 [Eisenbergiella massiliensis]
MSTRMMKDATGTALMAAMAGARRSRTKRKAAEREASRVPHRDARRKPPMIRKKEKAMEPQKSDWTARTVRRRKTETGDTRSISCPNTGWPVPRLPARRPPPRDGAGYPLSAFFCFCQDEWLCFVCAF